MAQTSSRISVALLVYYLSIHAELSLSAINELHNATIGEAETGNVSSVTPMTYIFQYDLKDLHDKVERVQKKKEKNVNLRLFFEGASRERDEFVGDDRESDSIRRTTSNDGSIVDSSSRTASVSTAKSKVHHSSPWIM